MGEVIARARRFRDMVRAGGNVPVSASQLWEGSHEEMHTKAIGSIDSESEFIEFLTANNAFTFPRLTDDPHCRPIADAYLAYLIKEGQPLARLPSNIEESNLVSKRTLLKEGDRLISTMFLLHLCVALRIKARTSGLNTVVEIGGGYGSLARIMRLFYPHQKYIIVDLLDSLFCSYMFLSVHFPNARTLFVTNAEQLSSIDNYDYVFVPTEYFDGMKGKDIDLVVNTCSLGEMPQSSVDRYMQFINIDARVRYFYSINRYGPFSAEYVMPDQANVSVKLDPNWRITAWDAFGENGFAQIEPVAPAYLELLAERSPTSDEMREAMAALLLASVDKLKKNSSAWHYSMWNAIRLWPSRPVIRDYLKVIEPLIFRDAPFYRELYVNAHMAWPAIPTKVEIISAAADAIEVAGLVPSARSGWDAIQEQLLRATDMVRKVISTKLS